MLSAKLSDMKLGIDYQFIIEMFVIMNNFPIFSLNKQTNKTKQKNLKEQQQKNPSPVIKNTKHKKVSDGLKDNRSHL